MSFQAGLLTIALSAGPGGAAVPGPQVLGRMAKLGRVTGGVAVPVRVTGGLVRSGRLGGTLAREA